MSLHRPLALLAGWACSLALLGGDLKIHVINVGWGSSVLVEGPTGTRVLLDAGHTNRAQKVVDYLQNVAKVPSGGIQYVVLGHNHMDHGGGLPSVFGAGLVAASPTCYYNGSTNNSSLVSSWFSTTGRLPDAAVPSTTPLIDLGGGARIYCAAALGRTLAAGSTAGQSSDENDNSLGLVVAYGGFSYLWTSDMGGFENDGCSGRTSGQADLETPMLQAAIAAGVVKPAGVDVLEIGHHGSESSSNPDYLRLAKPSVCVISTGRGQSSGWDLPRTAVVDNVLLGTGSGSCTGFTKAPLVLQTEDGDRNDQGKQSHSGYAVGNVVIDSDGSQFWVNANGDPSTINISDSSTVGAERAAAGLTGTADLRGRAFPVHGSAPLPGLTLTLGAGSLSLVPGQTASVPVTLGAANGFSGSVNLAFAPAVPGVTASFTPAAVQAPGTALLTLAASATAPVGTTSAQVLASSTTLGAQAPLQVQVTPAPSFSVALGSPSLSLKAGSSAAVPVTVTALNGFTGNVALSLGGSLSGVAGTFSPATLSVPGTATLTLSAATSAPAGSGTLNVVGSGGGLSRQAALGVVVEVPVQAPFAETEPNDTASSANPVGAGVTKIVGYFPSASDSDDWYQLALPAGRTLTVDMTGPTASAQDYDLYLYGSTASTTPLASSTDSGTTEHLVYKNPSTTAAKTLYLRVNRYASYSRVTPYTLALSR